MIRRFLTTLGCMFTLSTFACSNAQPTDTPGFCATFKTAATCYCSSSGLPPIMCQDMSMLYARLISVFGSLQKACEYQHNTSTQDCVDSWNCYLKGGLDSRGKQCSSTGKACQ